MTLFTTMLRLPLLALLAALPLLALGQRPALSAETLSNEEYGAVHGQLMLSCVTPDENPLGKNCTYY
jgi:hypothetical protein